MIKLHSLLVLSAAMLLSACGGQNPEPQAPEPQAQKPARVVPPSLSDARNLLTLRPGGIDRCADQDGVVSVEIEWNATTANAEGVHVYLQNPGEEAKLWSTAGAVGKDRTGEWMRDGSVVRLVNAGDNQDLATVTLKDVPCE